MFPAQVEKAGHDFRGKVSSLRYETVRDIMPFTPISLVGLASCEIREYVENGVRTVTSNLTATLYCDLPLHTKPLAFRLTDVHGIQYLMGTMEKPYPFVIQSFTNSNKPIEKNEYTLFVQWSGFLRQML